MPNDRSPVVAMGVAEVIETLPRCRRAGCALGDREARPPVVMALEPPMEADALLMPGEKGSCSSYSATAAFSASQSSPWPCVCEARSHEAPLAKVSSHCCWTLSGMLEKSLQPPATPAAKRVDADTSVAWPVNEPADPPPPPTDWAKMPWDLRAEGPDARRDTEAVGAIRYGDADISAISAARPRAAHAHGERDGASMAHGAGTVAAIAAATAHGLGDDGAGIDAAGDQRAERRNRHRAAITCPAARAAHGEGDAALVEGGAVVR